MPVTIKPASHGANPISLPKSGKITASGARALLDRAIPAHSKICHEIIQSSFVENSLENILPSNNGFVHAVIQAYNNHHRLIIRPEDVWFAILTQLSAYINKHAETLRGQFVAHEGQKELEIIYVNVTRYAVDAGTFARDMSLLLAENVVDAELRDWIIPTFSTTTRHDTVIASIIMMGAMQTYFSYNMCRSCGIPSVTLLGTKADWEVILARLDKLKTWGSEPAQFQALLIPIITNFVSSFDNPESPVVIDFWQHVASHISQGSGSDYYNGWVSAFCFWDEKGECLYDLTRQPYYEKVPNYTLDNVTYHLTDMKGVPPGWTSVPVKVNDYGYEFRRNADSRLSGHTMYVQ